MLLVLDDLCSCLELVSVCFFLFSTSPEEMQSPDCLSSDLGLGGLLFFDLGSLVSSFLVTGLTICIESLKNAPRLELETLLILVATLFDECFTLGSHSFSFVAISLNLFFLSSFCELEIFLLDECFFTLLCFDEECLDFPVIKKVF